MAGEVAAGTRRPRWAVAVRIVLGLLVVLVAVAAIVVRNAMKPRATPPPPLPSPNGYDDLIRAAGKLIQRGGEPNKGDIRDGQCR